MAYIISQRAAAALFNGRQMQQSNTSVYNNAMYLHCNKIAWLDDKNTICFCLCGWDTRTTCERLRACGLPIWHKRGVLYCGKSIINDCDKYEYDTIKQIATAIK